MAGAADSETSAVIGGVSLLSTSVQFSTDGKTFKNASETGVAVETTQWITTIDGVEGGYAVVGNWQLFGVNATLSGVAVSANGGASFKIIPTPSEIEARYGSFVSSSNWFVTTGQWPNNSLSHRGGHEFSRHIHWHSWNEGTNFSIHHDQVHQDDFDVESDDPPQGWFGEIWRTTDGGETFDLVYSNDTFYFNQISCGSEDVCYAAAENDDGAFVFKTSDGGDTWDVILNQPGLSIMAIEALSEEEVWVGGGILNFPVVGHAFHSTDGGATFTNTVIADNYISSFSFPDDVHGFATSLNTMQQSGILIYA